MSGKRLRKIIQHLFFKYAICKKINMYPAYISNHDLQHEEPNHSFNDSKLRRMSLCCSEELSALFRGKKQKNNGDFYCLNCLHSFIKKQI